MTKQIRPMRPEDLPALGTIWLSANLQAHPFIPAQYWRDNLDAVTQLLPQAEVYVHTAPDGLPDGFVGLNADTIEGIFIREEARSGGIGRGLLDFVKARRNRLTLHVYQQNTRALRFYLREGFQIQAQCRDQHTGEPEYVMIWAAV